jgi:ATP-binding cassette, subfamily B, bacterial PglK
MQNIYKTWQLFSKKLKVNFVFLFIFVLLSTFLEMFTISLLVPILNIFNGDLIEIKSFLLNYNLNFLISYLNLSTILIFFLTFFFLKTVFRIFVTHYQTYFVFNFFTKLLNRLYIKYIYKSYSYHQKNNSATLMRNLLNEIHQCAVGYVGAVTSIMLELTTVIGLVLILALYQPLLTLTFIFFISIVSILFISNLKKKTSTLGSDRQKLSLMNVKNIMESLGGIKEIKVNLKEKEVIKNFKKISEGLKKINYLIIFINQLPKLFLELIVVTSIVGLMLYFVWADYDIKDIVIYFALMIGIFSKILPSISKISSSFINLNFYKPSIDLLFDEINYKNYSNFAKENEKLNTHKISFNKKIEFKNLSFSYDQENINLKNINLKIERGDKIGIIGLSGSGKSTFINLLIGLLKPNNGEILVDDKNINLNYQNWYSKIGYVPQNVYINDQSIKDNITFYENSSDFNSKKYENSLKTAQIAELEAVLKSRKLDIGERGSLISGGQLQRIGLARALYKDSQILIFDESTSSLDEKTEKNFINDLNNINKDKTVIIVSHKKSALKNCKRILEIKDSLIKEIYNV